MATHSGVLAWRIPGTGEPGGLPSMGLHRVGHDWSDLAAAAAVSLIQGEKLHKHKYEESHFRQQPDSKVKTQMTIWLVFIGHVVWENTIK